MVGCLLKQCDFMPQKDGTTFNKVLCLVRSLFSSSFHCVIYFNCSNSSICAIFFNRIKIRYSEFTTIERRAGRFLNIDVHFEQYKTFYIVFILCKNVYFVLVKH